MAITLTPKRYQKSVKLNRTEIQKLVELRVSSPSDTQFAASLKIDRVSLIRIITIGSGSFPNVMKIRRRLAKI